MNKVVIATSDYQNMILPTSKGYEVINFKDVLAFKTNDLNRNRTDVHLSNGQIMIGLLDLEKIGIGLPNSRFYRTHRNSIINLKAINRYDFGRRSRIVLKKGLIIWVANDRKNPLLNRLIA